MSSAYKDGEEDWLTVCLKYLLFVFNSLFWVGGAAVLGVGVWTLVEKSEFLSLLASSTFAVAAYILILAGGLVVVTGFLGCCAVIREQRSCLSAYFFCLLLIFLIELVAGVLAYVYYQRLSEELKQHLKQTMTDNYAQPGKEAITLAVDKLQQDETGKNSSAAAATATKTGRAARTSRPSAPTAGWCPTAAVSRSRPTAASGTTRPTSTRWRGAASPSWSSSWRTTCWSSGPWASEWPVCRSVGWCSPAACTGGSRWSLTDAPHVTCAPHSGFFFLFLFLCLVNNGGFLEHVLPLSFFMRQTEGAILTSRFNGGKMLSAGVCARQL